MCKFFAILFFIIIPALTGAQILPKEGSRLNYRLIGFSFPVSRSANSYRVDIAAGYNNSEDSFKNNIIESSPGNENKIIGEVPAFGKEYTWRAAFVNKDLTETYSQLYHFTTNIIPNVDTNVIRLRVTKSAEKYKDAFVLADGTSVLYDMNGAPLWFLPGLDGSKKRTISRRDVKLSPAGTITYLFNDEVYEVNYNGDTLWKGPNDGRVSGGSNEGYHHEFTRLSNGHYMTLATELASWQLPSSSTLTTSDLGISVDSNHILHQALAFGTLIEYDAQGNVIWSWKSSDYIKSCDLYNRRSANGRFDIDDLHENSFFFDEQAKVIYLSFKKISRIIKIKYPEGNVLNTYGEIYSPGAEEKGNRFFCHQHCCKRSGDDYLYMFNNNDCDSGKFPKITVMQEPVSGQDSLKIVWEYECSAGDDPLNVSFGIGGSVSELPDHSIFASMDSKGNKAFIVNRDKKIIWSAVSEKWDEVAKKWKAIPNYRFSITTDRAALERLIWNVE